MCVPGLDPITLAIATAAAAGGSAINSYESNQNQKRMIDARNASTMAELERQRGMQAQANKVFDDSLNKFTPDQQAQALTDAQTTSTDALRGAAPTAESVGSISSAAAPTVVKTAEDKKLADAFGRIDNRNSALGKLTGWDQRAFGNNLNLNQSGRDLNLISDFAKTSAAVNGIEQAAASKNAFRPNSGLGDLLSFGGQMIGYQGAKAGGVGNLFKSTPAATSSAFNPAQYGALY